MTKEEKKEKAKETIPTLVIAGFLIAGCVDLAARLNNRKMLKHNKLLLTTAMDAAMVVINKHDLSDEFDKMFYENCGKIPE